MLKLKNLYLIPIIFLFLPACILYIGSNQYIRLNVIIVPLFILLGLVLNYKSLLGYLKFLYNKSPVAYLLIFLGWCIFVSLLAVIFHYYSFLSFSIYCVLQILFRIILIFIFPLVIIPAFFSLRDIIKIIYGIYIIIFIVGFIEFFAALFHIEPITNLLYIISNIRPEEKAVVIASSGLPRIRSVLTEPGEFGQFLAFNMPIIYGLSLSKFKIFDDAILNMVAKKTMIPLMWISIILIQSPIYTVICLIVTLIIFAKDIIKLLIKHKWIFISLFLFIVMTTALLFSFIDVEKTPLYRIIKVVSIFEDFTIEQLIFADVSLGARIDSYINQFLIFLKHPIFGIGFGNNEHIVLHQLLNSPVPHTKEITLKMQDKRILLNTNVMYLLLHQTGIIGYGLYCLFMVKTFLLLHKISKYFSGIEYHFVESLGQTIICLLAISSIYNIAIFSQFLWFNLGLACAIYIIAKKKLANNFVRDKIESADTERE